MDVATIQREFGLKVQNLRKKRGWTQERLAAAIARSVDTISDIERGFSSTRIETAAYIAEALGSTLTELFDFPSIGEADRAKRQQISDLIELIRPLDLPTIEAITAQAEILVRVYQRASQTKLPKSHRR